MYRKKINIFRGLPAVLGSKWMGNPEIWERVHCLTGCPELSSRFDPQTERDLCIYKLKILIIEKLQVDEGN